ncbi:MAG: hypothetical protein GTO51_10690 [Candidatus Latescibacteria bacterium]|nr:hypothetical protein [Candidatus Latescibacterota bacterium]NIM66433.1 hypothetical protein [Candidatus Latescibacterota bacterium]NIO02913.1 hypothetical protein [Candidatus Latescibacterota bacterium]NIO30048.1 hypothetical protein [Candidatus Latescibacterota bacterium]NIO57663.1 hypothetical protein [Candidatus Latescibacterota bacterium]
MKRLQAVSLFVVILSLWLLGCSGKNGRQSKVSFPDSIVDSELLATVNNYPIRGSDVRVFAAMSSSGKWESESIREYNERLLEQFIRRILLWQEAVAMSISVEDSTVQTVFMNLMRSMGGGEALLRMLNESGIEREDLLQSIQRDLVIREFLETRFSPGAAVGEEEARRFHEVNRGRFYTPDSVRARHILVQVSPSDNDSIQRVKRGRIEKILEEVQAGGDFATLAEQHSEGPSRVRGGDLGYFVRGTMVQPFDSVAFALAPGEVSDVILTRFGYHIIKVEDKRGGRFLAFEEIKDSLIVTLRQQKLAYNVQNHLKEIYDLAIIERNY